jgi:hypothetical protein
MVAQSQWSERLTIHAARRYTAGYTRSSVRLRNYRTEIVFPSSPRDSSPIEDTGEVVIMTAHPATISRGSENVTVLRKYGTEMSNRGTRNKAVAGCRTVSLNPWQKAYFIDSLD